MRAIARFSLPLAAAVSVLAGDLPEANQLFIQKHCIECHDPDTRKGGLDLTALPFDPATTETFSKWVLVHDRVRSGEMPPPKKARPQTAELESFTEFLN